AAGRELRKGPRGGGRDVQGIAEHVMNAEKSYLNRLARRHVKQPGESFEEEFARLRREVLDALAASVAGEVPERGPRGGAIWSARNYVRRIAWHVLDHAWEIED